MIASLKRICTASDRAASQQASCDARVPLTDVFTPDCVETLPASTSKSDLIRKLVQSLVQQNRLQAQHAQRVVDQLLEHESYGSSAIGKGLAFPHLRTSKVEQFVGAIGIASEGICLDALDQQPTKLVFLMLSPIESRNRHMDLLSRLVCLMKDTVIRVQLSHLLHADIYQYLRDLDQQLALSVSTDARKAQ